MAPQIRRSRTPNVVVDITERILVVAVGTVLVGERVVGKGLHISTMMKWAGDAIWWRKRDLLSEMRAENGVEVWVSFHSVMLLAGLASDLHSLCVKGLRLTITVSKKHELIYHDGAGKAALKASEAGEEKQHRLSCLSLSDNIFCNIRCLLVTRIWR